jgi:2-polyprenyl-3-methyl-5-hydroxy-6-metoxy-1,4-benzoquinol methylase
MERKAFELLHHMEDSWWYRGRAAVVRGVLAERMEQVKKGKKNVLDFGAGYGGMFNELAEHGDVYAFEPDSEAKSVARTHKYKDIYESEADALKNSYELIGLFDVLEHIEDDLGFLARAKGSLKKDGTLAITVPANPFLWSVHDVSHQHFRRYTKKTLSDVLQSTGYRVEYLSYWNAALFLPAVLARMLGSTGEGTFARSGRLENLMLEIVRIEASIIRKIPLPFGVSLVALARV